MKKISIYLVSVLLLVSMILPFTNNNIFAVEKNEVNNNIQESLLLSNNGKEKIEFQEDSNKTSFELTINKAVDEDKSKIQLELPLGIKYSGEENEVYKLDKERNELIINTTKKEEIFIIPLAIHSKELVNSSVSLTAKLITSDRILKSNEFQINKVTGNKNEEQVDALDINVKDEKISNIIDKNKFNEEVPANITEEAIGRSTTVPGIPAAPIPTEKTAANGASNEVDVSTWQAFYNAMRNSNINIIHVQGDFYNTKNDAREDNEVVPMRSITINGNGHVIDFRGMSFYNNSSLGVNRVVKWEINHLTMYGRNFYGPIKTDSSATASGAYGAMVYNNVTYIGAQLTASYRWTIDFSGVIENHSRNNYISPFDNKSRTAQENQVNIEAKDVVVRENGYYNGTTENAGVFRLQNSGRMTLEDHVDMTMTSGGNGGEHGDNVLYLEGKVITGKEAKLTLNTRSSGNQRAIEISGAGNGIEASQESEIHINTSGESQSRDVISMASNTSIIIDDGADLIIKSINKGSGSGNLISAGTRTNFIIGEKATFNAVSDGTGNHAILNFGSNSKFQFADAEQVNLQFVNNRLNSSARMIKMDSGNLDVDVQDVKAWTRNDIDTNISREADFHWTPMFGMITAFTNTNGTVQTGSSVMNDVRTKYHAEFKPQNFSRLLYSYIEDVEVGLINKPNDNVDSEDSKIIKGVANPGAYIRLTGDPALSKPSIPSIVNGSDEEMLTADYTVIADETGNFTVHAEPGEQFKTPNSINVFAFLGGKMDSQTVKVLDKTAPNGEVLKLAMVYNEELPNAEKFIINPSDSNPENKQYTYEFKEDYSALSQQEGKHNITILLGDEAENKKELTTTLEVFKDAFIIEADDFSVPLSELKKLETNVAIDDFLLQESRAKANGIIDNEFVDLTEHLTVNDLANIDQMKAGKYNIKIAFDLSTTNPNAKASKVFKVTVLNDEAIKPTNPENPGEDNEPDEKENTGTGQTGLLKLDYAPSMFEFGEVAYGFNQVKTNAIKTTSSKQWLQVSDHRAEDEITSWSVQVFENKELTAADGEVLNGATITIPKGKIYNEESGNTEQNTGPLSSKEVEITSTPKKIFSANNSSSVALNTSTNMWLAKDVSLVIPAGKEVGFKKYSNTVTWSLVAEPTE